MAYNVNFIAGHPVALPKVPPKKRKDMAPLLRRQGHVINYRHHSIILSKKRRFAFFSASNIDGGKWKRINRKGSFRKDTRAVSPAYQLGDELYNAITATHLRPNDFQQGHLTAFQQVLWGTSDKEIKKAADDTFFYTNCVPQHERLNVGLWRSLEHYILATQTVQHHLRVTVITGPVLLDTDPYYIEKVNGELVRIPCAFWKVVYYPNGRGLNAVGFIMSHAKLLLQDGTVTFDKRHVKEPKSALVVAVDLFMDYKYDAVYQVRVEMIQQKTGLQFMLKNVHLPYQQQTKESVVYKRIEVRPARSGAKRPPLDYKLTRITL